MLFRQAYATALKFVRARRGLSQLDVAQAVDASYVSRLESAKSSVTVDASDRLAQVLGLHPLSLLAIAYAAKESATPRELLLQVEQDLKAHGFLEAQISSGEIAHPLTAKGAQTMQAVLELKSKGRSQAEVAKALGLSTSTVGRHWHREQR